MVYYTNTVINACLQKQQVSFKWNTITESSSTECLAIWGSSLHYCVTMQTYEKLHNKKTGTLTLSFTFYQKSERWGRSQTWNVKIPKSVKQQLHRVIKECGGEKLVLHSREIYKNNRLLSPRFVKNNGGKEGHKAGIKSMEDSCEYTEWKTENRIKGQIYVLRVWKQC